MILRDTSSLLNSSRYFHTLLGVGLLAGSLVLAGCATVQKSSDSEKPATASNDATAANVGEPPLAQGWVELGPNSRWIVRTATPQTSCPEVEIDGHMLPLLERTKAQDHGQTLLICEGDVGPEQQYVTVLGHRHELNLHSLRKIVVIGDTGCRVKTHGDRVEIQDCNSQHAWPFAKMLNDVILPLHPDMIVHVGDYHYRESACPPGNKECDGSIAGDNVESWRQDFFTPASEALNQVNWLFVRGNHEVCKRAGETWFRFLDAHSYLAECADQGADSTRPLTSSVGDQTFTWVDAADDRNIQPSLDEIAKSLKIKSYLFMHRPFLIANEDDEAKTVNQLPASLVKSRLIKAVIVGHKHKFRINKFTDGRPIEIITGNGGTKLLQPDPNVRLREGWSASHGKGFRESTFWMHGFMTLEKHELDTEHAGQKAKWFAVEHDVEGKPVFSTPIND